LDLPTDGGPVKVTGWDWAWAYTMRAVGTSIGHLVVVSDHALPPEESFLIRVLAQQLAAAIRNARTISLERTTASEVASMNARLEATVGALRQRMDIHDRLTRAAVSGEGMDGITKALHEVTGRTVVIEDRFGNLRSWAGSGTPPALPKANEARRERQLKKLLRLGTPQWSCGRLLHAVSPRPDSIALLSLVDPDRSAGPADFAALEYGATILSLELARLRSMADTDVRLRRDLVEDLLSGTNLDSVVPRGETFQIDLTLPHVVAVFEGGPASRNEDRFFTTVGRGARDCGLGSLLVARRGAVVLITDQQPDWEVLQQGIVEGLGSGSCRIGVGGRVPTEKRSCHSTCSTATLRADRSRSSNGWASTACSPRPRTRMVWSDSCGSGWAPFWTMTRSARRTLCSPCRRIWSAGGVTRRRQQRSQCIAAR
jgi:hypothetical protein